MPLLYLLLLVVMMFLGGMLIRLNPDPVQFRVAFGSHFTIEASILELIGYSALGGAVAMAIPYLRQQWLAARERAQLTQAAATLRDRNDALAREAEHARTTARLLEAHLAEAEERYAQLEASARPLLTMRRDALPLEPGQPRPARRSRRPADSRWRRT